MLRRTTLVAIIALAALALAACGVGQQPTPTPTNTQGPSPTPTLAEPLTATCFATEAYALELISAIIGEDPVPTAFDNINSGGCEFSAPVTEIIIRLVGEGGTQQATIALLEPSTDIGVPLSEGVSIALVDTDLKPGRYERTVTAKTADGQSTTIQGFEPVLLVPDEHSVQTRLLRAQSRWERSGIDDYTYTISWICECGLNQGPVEVTVENGQVVGGPREGYGTIDALFEMLQEAIDHPADSVTAAFEETYGYPTEGRMDYIHNAIDDELEFEVLSFDQL
jgi:hypothetical protein